MKNYNELIPESSTKAKNITVTSVCYCESLMIACFKLTERVCHTRKINKCFLGCYLIGYIMFHFRCFFLESSLKIRMSWDNIVSIIIYLRRIALGSLLSIFTNQRGLGDFASTEITQMEPGTIRSVMETLCFAFCSTTSLWRLAFFGTFLFKTYSLKRTHEP